MPSLGTDPDIHRPATQLGPPANHSGVEGARRDHPNSSSSQSLRRTSVGKFQSFNLKIHSRACLGLVSSSQENLQASKKHNVILQLNRNAVVLLREYRQFLSVSSGRLVISQGMCHGIILSILITPLMSVVTGLI